ncbi:MAG: extracellular solute-binding protein [Acholeplasmatales bacterium]|jgi:arabinogalactan oligomer/maltooligosaccharide transport system substrate-binding protein|nr:extracellular solute-binding protein [Acholeplasmatales bacterium]
MKKLTIIFIHLLALITIFVVVGTIPKKRDSQTNKFDGILERNVTIQILENDTAIKQGYLKELLDSFNRKYAEYGIVAKDANMDQYSDLEQDGPYGYGPDVLYQANDRLMRYVDGKHITPIPVSTLDTYNQIDENAWKAYNRSVEGTAYTFGVPVNIQGPLMYYRKDLLPSSWRETYDKNNNDIPDMLENWNDMYRFSLEKKNAGFWGYMRSFLEPYFSSGFLFSYGGYAFGDDDTNQDDIGFSKGEAYKGIQIIRQLASVMDERCIDDTITVTAYSQLAKGNFFATITTPDVYTLFVDEFSKEGVSLDNLGIANIPYLPKSGDLTEENPELIPCKMMGGIQGYAISSYTKAPNASLAFVDFATSYNNISRRNVLLGIAPARNDVALEVGGLSQVINDNIKNGFISIMPSIKATGQIWTPLQTLFQDIAKDPFRSGNEQAKYLSKEQFQAALEKVDKQIYDAIHTLQ